MRCLRDDTALAWNLPDDILYEILSHIYTRSQLTRDNYWSLCDVILVSHQFHRVAINNVASRIRDVEHRCLHDIVTDGNLPWFQGLTRLEMRGHQHGRRLGHITRLTRLECLTLTNFFLETGELGKMTCLRNLTLDRIDGDTTDLRLLTNLTCLELGSTSVEIDDLLSLTAIKSLDCHGRQHADGLSRLTSLSSLSLRGNEYVIDDDIRGMTNLTWLDLTFTKTTNDVLDSMPQLREQEDEVVYSLSKRVYIK